jgi:hypothetical protein
MKFEHIKRNIGPLRSALIVNDSIEFIENKNYDNYDLLLNHKEINKTHTDQFLKNTMLPSVGKVPINFRDTMRVLNTIRKDSNIVFFLSIGRSGTMFFYRIFQEMEYSKGFHHIAFPISGFLISEMFYRGILGAYDEVEHENYPKKSLSYFLDIYTRSRTIELLHSSISLTGIFNHWDSWFSPLMRQLFPTVKFVYIKRNPIDTISSHLCSSINPHLKFNLQELLQNTVLKKTNSLIDIKSSSNCIPLDSYKDKKDGQLIFNMPNLSKLDNLVWKYKTMENLSLSIKNSVSEHQFHEISFEKLFQNDPIELDELVDFLNLRKSGKKLLSDNITNKINSKRKVINLQDQKELKKIIEQNYKQ